MLHLVIYVSCIKGIEECGGCRFEGFNAPYVRTLATVGFNYLLVVEVHLVKPRSLLYCYLQHFLRPPLLCVEMLRGGLCVMSTLITSRNKGLLCCDILKSKRIRVWNNPLRQPLLLRLSLWRLERAEELLSWVWVILPLWSSSGIFCYCELLSGEPVA